MYQIRTIVICFGKQKESPISETLPLSWNFTYKIICYHTKYPSFIRGKLQPKSTETLTIFYSQVKCLHTHTHTCVCTPLTQDLKQQKQVSKAKAWEAEFTRKCQPLRPIKIGCLWTSGRGAEQHQEEGVVTVSKDMEFLKQFEAVPLVELPVAVETKGETTAAGVHVCTCMHEV